MHAVWNTLLDDKFLHAYEHGIVLKCADGIFCRIYPRIFTYSADYPEKYVTIAILHQYLLTWWYRVLLTTIRDGSEYLCPRCLVPCAKLNCTGLLHDTQLRLNKSCMYALDKVRGARNFIYQQGRPVDGVAVHWSLDFESLVPTMVMSSVWCLRNPLS